MGLWLAEQNVGNVETCTINIYGNPTRITKHRKSLQIHFQKFWDSSSQDKTSETSKTCTVRNSGLQIRAQAGPRLKPGPGPSQAQTQALLGPKPAPASSRARAQVGPLVRAKAGPGPKPGPGQAGPRPTETQQFC